jgi:hypothetical protein
MKFASEHQITLRALKDWASPAKLCTASYYFWNQGFEMQKSQLGLFQTLLYQILRNDPGLIPRVCPDRRHYEAWDIKDLKEIFKRIATQTVDSTRFCFFIDGLDEYDGVEEDVVTMLKFLSSSCNIKICASSRPRSMFEEFFHDKSRILVIHDFTKEDMKTSIKHQLVTNEKFQRLEGSNTVSEKVAEHISNQAQGVWLWVFLVMRDLLQAVNRNEDLYMLLKIIDQFPPDLKSYFEQIIKRIKREYREEMAQIFLITIDEVQPLPLFAISLLDKERTDPDYALNASIRPISDDDLSDTYQTWKSRAENRCGDLLVVNDGPHPIFLSHPVDFLHRTVREYLQDCYYQQLKDELVSEFIPMLSLAKITLHLLKSLPVLNFREKFSINKVIGLTDELLYYAHEVESRSDSVDTRLVAILDELDKVNSHHARSLRNHWTHARDSPSARPFDKYREGGNCNFLALTVQARLVKYVRAKLQADPQRIHKSGRPLLDYALRPRRSTPITMPYHSQRDEPSVDVDMVRLLLDHGADSNKNIHLNEGRTVWAQFLLSCYESSMRGEASSTLQNAWYQVSVLLIKHGARSDCWFVNDREDLTLPYILNKVFGEESAVTLQNLMEREKSNQAESSCVVS